MAITKLMHMKEAPVVPHTHLKNAIDYVLDVKNGQEKTEGGLYVGGNAGYTNDDILETFLNTKREYGKEHGRQGYHFVISFAPGECDPGTAYEVAKEFCESYLGEQYDYLFAVHTDKDHLHAHIIFNSVSRTTGLKYHYKEGDWAREIQPVTDRICKEHNLSELRFEEERVGVSYASWANKQTGKLNWSHIIQADIDYAISRSKSFDEFLENMKQMHYDLRIGRSRKRDSNYITFQFKGEDGKVHRRRSYSLATGYDLKDIVERIRNQKELKSYEKVGEQFEKKASAFLSGEIRLTGFRVFTRLYQAVNYYKLPNPYAVPAAQVRSDMLRMERLIDECRFLRDHHIRTTEDLLQMDQAVCERYGHLCSERRQLYSILDAASPELRERMEQYHDLQLQFERCRKDDPDAAEQIQDQMEELKKNVPYHMLQLPERISACRKEMEDLRRQKKMICRIKKTEGSIQKIPNQVVVPKQ